MHASGGERFFNTLLNHIYTNQNEGLVCVCGDFNARCDDEIDSIEGVDQIPEWDCIDRVENEYGDLQIDVQVNTNIYMLNGCIYGIYMYYMYYICIK